MQVIIYKSDAVGAVSVIIPAPEYVGQIEAVAAKDVPPGRPWRIIDCVELPDRSTRDRWRWTDVGPVAVAAE